MSKQQLFSTKIHDETITIKCLQLSRASPINYLRRESRIGNLRRFLRRRFVVGGVLVLGLFNPRCGAASEASIGIGVAPPLFTGFSPPLQNSAELSESSVFDAVQTSTSAL